VEYETIQNFLEYYSRKNDFKEIYRVRGFVPLGWNAKGIPGNTFTKSSYGNLQRNHPIDGDEQPRPYAYNFAFLYKYNMFLYFKWLFY